MIVVDASAILELLLRTPAAASVERRLFGGRETLHAPHLLDVEVAHVIRRYALAGEVSAEQGGEALEDLEDLPSVAIRMTSFYRACGRCAPI